MNKVEVCLKVIEENTYIDFKYSSDKEDNIGSDDIAYALLKLIEASDHQLNHVIKDLVQNAIDMRGFDLYKEFNIEGKD